MSLRRADYIVSLIYNGVITHLEPDILECKVKWALGSISMNKAGRSDRIPVELFQVLKDDVVKVLHSICQQIWKTQQWPQDWKRSVCIPTSKKGNAKECSNYHTIALISHASEVMFKILQARLQQYVNWELPDVQAGFRKGRGNGDQIACWITGFPGCLDGKESVCNVGDQGSIPGLGRSPEGGHGNTLQYSCLENPHGQRSLVGCGP